MRLRTLLLLLPLCAVTWTSAAQQAPAPPAVGASANIKSPEVSASRNVTFRLAAPRAAAVSVICECLTLEETAKLEQQIAALGQRPAADPELVPLTRELAGVRNNQGARAMAKDPSGLWTLTLNNVAPDFYEYHFKVDDFEMLDPRNLVVKYNSRPNLIESILEVPGNAPLFYDIKPVPHGKVDIRYYDSKSTSSTRKAWIYTPAGYEKSSAKLPVLYLLHGADGDETVWTTMGKMNNVLDNLIAEKKAPPMIIVTPSAYAYPPTSGVAGDKQRADFEKDLLTDLIPFVQANYRVAADRDHRALAGLSMGGSITLALGPRHLETFSRIAVFSAGAGNTPETSMKDVVANAKNVNAQLKMFWMGIGTEDPGFAGAKKTSDFLDSVSIKHTFKTMPGAHTWIVWRNFLNEVAPQLWGSAFIHQLARRFVFIAAMAALIGYGSVYYFDLNSPPIRSDGFSYYIYLPAWFIHHDPSLEKTAAECCGGTFPTFTAIFRLPSTGRWVNPHPIGEAILLAPFFLVADGLTRWANLPRDGFSIYYQYIAGLAGIAYFAAGLALLRRTLRRRFSEGVTLATLVCITWATNLYHYATYDSVFAHVFAFFLFAALLELGMEWLAERAKSTGQRAQRLAYAVVIGLVAALIILVRHTNGLMLLFLAGLLVQSGQLRARWTDVAVAGFTMGVVLIPQVLIYHYASGQWLFSPYGPNGHFDFTSPHIFEVLLGTKKGLFFWSPILLLGVAGFPLMRRQFPGLFLPTLIVLPATAFIIASWSDWQMGGSFGHRGFTDFLPIFAIGLASFFDWSSARRWAPAITVFASLAVALSMAQMVQYWLRIIPFSDTTWELYTSVFLKFTR